MASNIFMYSQTEDGSRKVEKDLLMYKNKFKQNLNSIDVFLSSFEGVAFDSAKCVHKRHFDSHALNIFLLHGIKLNTVVEFLQ